MHVLHDNGKRNDRSNLIREAVDFHNIVILVLTNMNVRVMIILMKHNYKLPHHVDLFLPLFKHSRIFDFNVFHGHILLSIFHAATKIC